MRSNRPEPVGGDVGRLEYLLFVDTVNASYTRGTHMQFPILLRKAYGGGSLR